MTAALLTNNRSGHPSGVTQRPPAAAVTLPAGASETVPPRMRPPRPGTESPAAKGQPTPNRHSLRGPILHDPLLWLAAQVVDDLEDQRKANANRLRILTATEADSDGTVRGFGLDESHPDVARQSALVRALEGLEHDAVLGLQRRLRKHPLWPWLKPQRGVGPKVAARLLAAIGDPYWNTLHDRPRTVSELWAYCGLHVLPAGQMSRATHLAVAAGDQTGSDPGPVRTDAHPTSAGVAAKRRKGQRANWSTVAKTRAYLIAESCLKQLDPACKTDTGIAAHQPGCACSPYRVVIDQRREHTAQTHPEWSAQHSLNDALRIASKAFLKDLWREAKRIREEQS